MSPVPVEQIVRQPDSEVDCALYALLNLYVWAGLEPPIEEAQAAKRKVLAGAANPDALLTMHQYAVLVELGFPRLVTFGVMSPSKDTRDYFPRLIDEGFGVVFGILYSEDGQLYGHSLVAESWSDAGVLALCSGSPKHHGRVVQWEVTGSDEETVDERNHGNKSTVPWRTIPYDVWAGEASGAPLGICRDFLVAWPS